jgi:hypothetical protein
LWRMGSIRDAHIKSVEEDIDLPPVVAVAASA